MQKERTKNSREYTPRGRVYSSHYEGMLTIMRTEPGRFRRFSPQSKLALAVYLDLKRGDCSP